MTSIDGKLTHMGTYDTTKEAAIAYDRAILKANKSTTLLNFPDMVHNLDKCTKHKLSSVQKNSLSGLETLIGAALGLTRK